MNIIFTPNLYLTKVLSIFVFFLEIHMNKMFFVHAFNLHVTKFKTFALFAICFILNSLCVIFLPCMLFYFVNIILTFSCFLLFFRQNFMKSMFILLISVSIFQLLKFALILVISSIIDISPITLMNIPATTLLITFFTYLAVLCLFKLFKEFNFSQYFSKDLNFVNNIFLTLFCIFALLSIFINIYLFYNYFISSHLLVFFAFIVLNIFLLIVISMLIFKTTDLQDAKNTIDYEKKLYDSLSSSYESIREFKHDFSNIMQSIGGYLFTNDLDGLKSYYSSIFKECEELKKLSNFNKDVLNSPPVLSLITQKYYKAKELGIEFNIEVFIDLTKLNVDIYEFTRVLGIFLDNSIEAASKTSKKIINIIISKDIINHYDSIIIENSCYSEGIDTSKIFDKNFSTKPKNSGIGLWKVKKILSRYDNIRLNTSVSDNLFRHQLKIYY